MDFICEFADEHGYVPTVRETQRHIGNASTNGIYDIREILVRKGWIEKSYGKFRAMRILARPGPNDCPPRTPPRTVGSTTTVSGIQVVSYVTRGVPVVRQERVIDVVKISRHTLPTTRLFGLHPTAKLFGLRMDGASMVDDGIMPGDYVIVAEGAHRAKGGELVVVLLGETAVVKRIAFEDTCVRFSPSNAAMGLEPVVMKVKAFSASSIVGVVVGIYRKIQVADEEAVSRVIGER